MNKHHENIAWAIGLTVVSTTLIISITAFFISLKEHDLQMAILKSKDIPQVVIESETP